jgi:hypothetical protein
MSSQQYILIASVLPYKKISIEIITPVNVTDQKFDGLYLFATI